MSISIQGFFVAAQKTASRPRSTPLPAAADRERILDVAEKLFARRGFRRLGPRHHQEAGVDVALVNYHFGSKQALLDSVLTRRSGS